MDFHAYASNHDILQTEYLIAYSMQLSFLIEMYQKFNIKSLLFEIIAFLI